MVMLSEVEKKSTDKPLTNCQLKMADSVQELRATLQTIESIGPAKFEMERETHEADICLGSRSAYFDFYTWVVLHDEIDGPAQKELDELFRRSLQHLKIPEFRSAVKSRYKEFQNKCKSVLEGAMSSEFAASL
jgi:hypothetical protein